MNKYGQKSYTYLIGWRRLDVWYYGVRWNNSVSPQDDLWVKYQTSSRYVKAFVLEHGDPDTIRISRCFDDPKMARAHEMRFIKQLKCHSPRNTRWLNQGIPNGIGGHFVPHSEETKRLIGHRSKERWKDPQFREKAIRRGHRLSVDQRKKISEFQILHKNTSDEKKRQSIQSKKNWTNPDVKEKASKSHRKFWSSERGKAVSEKIKQTHTGKIVSEETRSNLRKARIGYRQQIVSCPFCPKTGNKSIMTRWHMDNCRHK